MSFSIKKQIKNHVNESLDKHFQTGQQHFKHVSSENLSSPANFSFHVE